MGHGTMNPPGWHCPADLVGPPKHARTYVGLTSSLTQRGYLAKDSFVKRNMSAGESVHNQGKKNLKSLRLPQGCMHSGKDQSPHHQVYTYRAGTYEVPAVTWSHARITKSRRKKVLTRAP
eukprot:752320-Pelagomonas_calceolata.AAC.2